MSHVKASHGERKMSLFARLPDELLQHILCCSDPPTFASLVLVSPAWWQAAQREKFYASQLSRCPSYLAKQTSQEELQQLGLPVLRRLFAQEIKRNLFPAYLQPTRTTVNIITNSISSFSAPGGEGLSFQPSPDGSHILAYNSSRIYVLSPEKSGVQVQRELKVLRRPIATCIKNDGTLLAVLLTEAQVDVYDLTSSPPRRTQSVSLDYSPRTIALSPCGTVLAAAYDGGIEVTSLEPSALIDEKRAVKCYGVDALAFSLDGTQILATTLQTAQPNTVVLTAPYYDPASRAASDSLGTLWTTSILFPNGSRDCSHAALLQPSRSEEAAWTFTYDRSFETFRAIRIDDLRNGTTYFTGPIPDRTTGPSPLVPCTIPAASPDAQLAAAGFKGKEIWVYGIPEDLEHIPSLSLGLQPNTGTLSRRISASSNRSHPRSRDESETRVPQWEILCDKNRSAFVKGHKVAELSKVTTTQWLSNGSVSTVKQRLMIAAKGLGDLQPFSDGQEAASFTEGGRLVFLDFDYGPGSISDCEVTIEIGSDKPEILEEQHRDLDAEVAIARRRTIAQKRAQSGATLRPVRNADATDSTGEDDQDEDQFLPRRLTVAPPRASHPISTEQAVEETIIEEEEALDAPYAQTGPRTVTTLRRSATAVASHRRLHPRLASGQPIEGGRSDGRAEHPHESDADRWVPPPPAYQQENTQDPPAFLRHQSERRSAPQPADAASQPSQRLRPRQTRHIQTSQSHDDQEDTHAPMPISSALPPSQASRLVTNKHQGDHVTMRPRMAVSTSHTEKPSSYVHDGDQRRGERANAYRTISESQTWPLAMPSSSSGTTSFPLSAPIAGTDRQDFLGSAQSGQEVHTIRSGEDVRRSWAATSVPRPLLGPGRAVSSPMDVARLNQGAVSDQPLIISTPAGISGAFDDPNSSDLSQILGQASQQQIVAPTPRRPRPLPGDTHPVRATAQHLEAGFLPSPAMAGPSIGSRGLSLRRKKSRAGRSAKKNISDAKRRGWRARARGAGVMRDEPAPLEDVGLDPLQQPNPQFLHENENENVWSDDDFNRGRAAKTPKGDKKCVVM